MKKEMCATSLGSVAVTESRGAGRPVLLVHGNSMSAESYTHQLAGEPGERWRLIAVDFPGHGASPRATDPDRAYSLAGYASVLRDVALSRDLHRPILVGHSLGGHVAIQAIAGGLDAGGILVFGTPPLRNPPDFGAAFTPLAARGLLFKGELEDAEVDCAAGWFMPAGAHPPGYYARSIRATDPAAREHIGRDARRGAIHDERGVLVSLGRRAALLSGELDRLISLPYIHALGITTCWRGAVQIIPGAGHCPEFDSPEAFNRLLIDFLTDLAE
jgi:pimeloyl-ACP methyl ester carboxylesterase